MQKLPLPFNIDLLIPDKSITDILRPVTSLDAFNAEKNFHPNGLYSIETFGVVGTPQRDRKFSYIDIKVPVIHPIIYKLLTNTKSLYKGILNSSEFAVWDKELSDFVKSNASEGSTGYQFFIEHFEKIQIEQRPSTSRQQSIRLFEKVKKRCLVNTIMVIPAGYRDLEVDENGRDTSDEINDLYYKLLSTSNTINSATVSVSPEAYNRQRMVLQNTFNEIYNYIYAIVDGKKNLMMGKWASRKIFDSTRNVITSSDTSVQDLDDPNKLDINDTSIGLFQSMKALLPVTIYHLKVGFLSTVFGEMNAPVLVTNRNTLMSERVELDSLEYERWLTNEGLEKSINYYKENSIRHNPIMLGSGNYYLGLIYRGKDATFRLIHGIDELPPDRKKEDCYPITFTELFYLSIYQIANSYPVLITRYPITGIGSVYTSRLYLKTTIDSEVRTELDNDWNKTENICREFPIKTSSFFNSMAPNSSRLKGLSADFDGD